MAEKLKTGEKSKRLESEKGHPARRGKLAEKTRKKVDDLALLGKFEKSEIGQNVLSFFEAENMAEVLEDKGKLYSVVSTLGGEPDQVDRKGALALLVIVSRKFPDFMKESICDPGFDVQLHDKLIAEMGWNPAELPSMAIEPLNPQKTAETPKSKKGSENPESLVGELEKTKEFEEVLDRIEREEMMDGLRERYKSIDWEQVVVDMADYSVKGVEVYSKKKKLTLDRKPRPNSAKELMSSDSERLERVLLDLGADHNGVDPRHFCAFALLAAEINPQFVFNYFLSKPLAEIKDVDSKKALVQLLKAKGLPATDKIFEPVELVDGVDPYEVKKTFLEGAKPSLEENK